MNKTRSSLALIALLVLFSSGCDKGLAPLNEESGFSGVIHFRNWPAAGQPQVLELRLVAFNVFPRDSVNLLLAALSGGAVAYPPIGATGFPRGKDTLHYEFTTKGGALQVRSYEYVAVAWRFGPNSFADWRPAGVYTLNPGSFEPATVRVLLHRIQTGIDIECDFQNPPPRPWR